MTTLNFMLAAFILLEISNVLALYFNPTMKRANAMGVFRAYSSSQKDPAIHDLTRYLVFWVAGTKVIFLALLIVILFFAAPFMKVLAVFALVASIAFFYWRMFPLIRKMDNEGMITPKGYSRTLGLMIGAFMLALGGAAIIAYVGIV